MARYVIALGLAAGVLSLGASGSQGATFATGVLGPSAFGRSPTPKDRFPHAWLPSLTDPTIRDVRLIATERLATGRSEELFAYSVSVAGVSQTDQRGTIVEVCTALGSATYEGGDCEPETDLCSTPVCQTPGASPLDWYTTNNEVVLLAGNAVTTIAIQLRSGTTVSLPLPNDRGLIWPCSGDCGCTVSRITAYDHERIVATDDLVDHLTGRLYWCEPSPGP